MSEMPAHGRIIVGVDLSAHAARAAVWAARETVARRLRLHLVYALDLPRGGRSLLLPENFAEAGRTASAFRIAHDVHRLEHTVKVTTESLIASGGEGDLIVTGTRGHAGFAGLLLGSVSLRAAAHSRFSHRTGDARQPRAES
jgi:nucleotide-binding universal stress UspA family protein